MTKTKSKFGWFALALVVVLPVLFLFAGCGETYEMSYGYYKNTGSILQVDRTTGEETTLETAIITSKVDFTFNDDGTAEVSNLSTGNVTWEYKVNKDGYVNFTGDGGVLDLTAYEYNGYFKDGKFYFLYASYGEGNAYHPNCDLYAICEYQTTTVDDNTTEPTE